MCSEVSDYSSVSSSSVAKWDYWTVRLPRAQLLYAKCLLGNSKIYLLNFTCNLEIFLNAVFFRTQCKIYTRKQYMHNIQKFLIDKTYISLFLTHIYYTWEVSKLDLFKNTKQYLLALFNTYICFFKPATNKHYSLQKVNI